MEKVNTGKLIVTPNPKGGVGKTELALNIIAPFIFDTTGKKVKVLSVDDNNKTVKAKDTEIFEIHNFRVDRGIDENQKALFEVFDGNNVIVDAGGGNDSLAVIDAVGGLNLADETIFCIPIFNEKRGIKNL